MPLIESTQHKLDRIRPPRVQITYDVEIGDAIEQVELPFVFGIIADLAGAKEDKTQEDKTPVKARQFVPIDRDNFNQIMAAIGPTLDNLQVDATIPGRDGAPPAADTKLPAFSLRFTQMADFDPANVVQQVPPLRDLLIERQRLRDLQAKLDGNDALRDALLKYIVHKSPEGNPQ